MLLKRRRLLTTAVAIVVAVIVIVAVLIFSGVFNSAFTGGGNHAISRVMPAILESGNEISGITTANKEKRGHNS